jgi:predicted kinase
MPIIEILMGMIASGKSSYCKQKAKEGFLVMNNDSIITMLHGGDYTLYNEECKPIYKELELEGIETPLYYGKSVIVDRTNLQAKTRLKYLDIAKVLAVPVNLIVFKRESPEIHAKRRADSDGRGHDYEYWLKVAKLHYSQWEDPAVEELNKYNEVRYI